MKLTARTEKSPWPKPSRYGQRLAALVVSFLRSAVSWGNSGELLRPDALIALSQGQEPFSMSFTMRGCTEWTDCLAVERNLAVLGFKDTVIPLEVLFQRLARGGGDSG
jgi:hypothetical protein